MSTKRELYYVLRESAGPIALAILSVCTCTNYHSLASESRRLAGEISTRLHLIHTYMRSFPPYLAEDSLDQLAVNLLQDLAEMLNYRQRLSEPSPHFNLDAWNLLYEKSALPRYGQVKTSGILSFFKKADLCRVQVLNENCIKLYNLLAPEDIQHVQNLPADPRFLEPQNYPIDLDNLMFKVLQTHLNHGSLEASRSDIQVQVTCQSSGHPARLCLSDEDHSSPAFNLLVASSLDMTSWQDFLVVINTKTDSESVEMSRQQFCELLQSEPTYARVPLFLGTSRGLSHQTPYLPLKFLPASGNGQRLSSILRNYILEPRHKIILAHCIARAYWQFYGSELMHIRWTSQTVWLLPAAAEFCDSWASPGRVPLRPYLEFPPLSPSNPMEENISDERVTHRYPYILAIGILLLEIGLAEPFPFIHRSNIISQTNRDLMIANSQLRLLKKSKWDGFLNKEYFDKAVEYCLDYQEEQTDVSIQDPRDGVLRRRRNFYKHVLKPLGWLAKRGFETQDGELLFLNEKTGKAPIDSNPSISEPSFHAGKAVRPTSWFKDLTSIGAEVERQRRQIERAGKPLKPIRVAILDTGFSLLEQQHSDDRISSRIIGKKDFVRDSEAEDYLGHGTFMTNLVMRCAPFVEIIVARVAENTVDLPRSQEKIKEAILWAAGKDCHADIISMSFGFPIRSQHIEEAIDKVQSTREKAIIFMASAGNSPSEPENFPARHSSVMSIYATDCNGEFSKTNPRPQDFDEGAAILGTYGGSDRDLPEELCNAINERYPNTCKQGSSVATAVAAGIAATMLAYVDVLPHLITVEPSYRASLNLLRETKGMEMLFKAMAHRRRGDSCQWFVDPISFWRDAAGRQTEPDAGHFSRFCVIESCLRKLI